MKFKTTFCVILCTCLITSCKQSIDQLFDKAYILTKEKKYKEAIETYNELIQRNSKLQLAYYNRGICLLNTKNYKGALYNFNKVMELQTYGNVIISFNKNMAYADEEVRAQVPYYDALYQRAQVKYHMDSIKSSFKDFQELIDNNFEHKSNCIVWQGTIWVRSGRNDKACEYFQRAIAVATTDEDRQDANEYILEYCSQKNNR